MKIGITGGIGSGKSTVSNYLRNKGYKIVDADLIAREIVEPGMPALSKLVNAFGGEILNENGELRRKYLGELIFKDVLAKKKIDDIMLVEINKVIINEFKDTGNNIVFLDAPLLFEGGLDNIVDETWVIIANTNERIARVSVRDNISKQDVLNRIDNQMSDEDKMALADKVIYNTGSKEELYSEIDKVMV